MVILLEIGLKIAMLQSLMIEMKIKSEWLTPYDVDNSKGLSTKELEVVPCDDIALNIAFLSEDEKQKALDLIRPLPSFKLARIFQNNSNDELWQQAFVHIAIEDPKKAAGMLIQMQESPFKSRDQGLTAHLFLRGCEESIRSEVLSVILTMDPQYHSDILSVPKRTASFSPDSIKEPEPQKSPEYPKPNHVELPQIADPSGALYVEQQEYGLSKPEHARYIQTAGAFPCVILVLYDPKSKVSVLSHLDGSLKLEDSIDIMLHDMEKNGANKTTVVARLFGGEVTSAESPETIYRLKRYLKDRSVPIVQEDILPNPQLRGTSITFDTETGQAYRYDETYGEGQGEEAVNHVDMVLEYTKYNLVTRREPKSFGAALFKEEPQTARAAYIRRVNPELRSK